MNKYNLIGLIALLLLVSAMPLYALSEPMRLERAQAELRREYIADGALMYVENCATCHGAGGEGLGATPALDRPALVDTDIQLLYRTIAHSPHGSSMAAWHLDEGGILNEYQVDGLVTLIRNADWSTVRTLAQEKDLVPAEPAPAEIEIALIEPGEEENPHECRSCHEEPEVHADRFGLNCSRCHTLEAWKPALLTRHTFELDHGDQGQIACQTCHVSTYADHTCYECHDHEQPAVEDFHLQENIVEYGRCVECHPTGAAGEAERLGFGHSSVSLPSEPDTVQAAQAQPAAAVATAEPEVAPASAAPGAKTGAQNMPGPGQAAGKSNAKSNK